MGQTNLDGDSIQLEEPFWMIDGEDCRYWKEEKGSKEYKRKCQIYSWKYRQEHREERKVIGMKYRQNHQKDIIIANSKYYRKHRERILEQQQMYYQEHRDEKKEYDQKYRQIHKEGANIKKRKYYQELKELVWSIKRPICACCGDQECRLMHFHHIYTPKLFGIMNGTSKSEDEIRVEIKKCVVLCANCHEMLHKVAGKGIVKPFSDILSGFRDQKHHPIMKWLIFLLYPEVYPQTLEEWHEVWG